MKRAKRVLAGWAIVLMAVSTAAKGGDDRPPSGVSGDPGVVISTGAQPYTETWAEMVVRSPFRTNPDLPEPPPHVLSDVPGVGGAPVRTGPGWSVRGPGPTPCPTLSGGWVGNTYANIVAGVGTSGSPPSPAVAVGHNHILEVGGGAVSIYDRQGTRLSMVGQASFFTLESGGVTYPRNGAIRSRAMFQPEVGRFFVTAIERGDPSGTHNHIVLAVSRTGDPTGTWDKYVLPIGEPTANGVTWFTDWCQIGLDGNGFTVGALLFSSGGSTISRVITTRWSELTNSQTPTLGPVWQFDVTGTFGPPIPSTSNWSPWEFGSAWLVNITSQPALEVRRIVWSYNNQSNSWSPALDANVASLPVPTFNVVLNATILNGSSPTLMWDYRVTSVYRSGSTLWTCNTVGTNISGTETNPDRNGIDWARISLGASAASGTRSIAARGRIVDSAMVFPISYCFPALAVTSTDRVALVFCGGGPSRYMSVFACGRVPTDAIGVMRPVTVVKEGESVYSGPQSAGRFTWGYYSGIAPDPIDGSTVWSAVQYASTGFVPNPNWGVHLGRLVTRPPPMPVSTSPTALPRGFDGALTVNRSAPDGEAIINDWRLPRSSSVRFGSGAAITNPAGASDLQVYSDGYVERVFVPNTTPLGGVGATITNPDGQSTSSAGPVVTIVEPAIPNDWCAGAHMITPAQLPFDQTLSFQAATPSSWSYGSDVWYAVTPNADGMLEVRASGVSGEPQSVSARMACEYPTVGSGYGAMGVRVVAGQTVYVQIDEYSGPGFFEPVRVQIAFHPVQSLLSPCDTAPLLTVGIPFSGTPLQNTTATPARTGVNLHSIVPSESGWYRIFLSGPNGSFTRAICGVRSSPCRVGVDESVPWSGFAESNGPETSSEPFWMQAGQEHAVLVERSDFAVQPYTVTIRSISSDVGDACADAVRVPLPSVAPFNTSGALPPAQFATTTCGATSGIAMHQDRWYRLTLPRDGTIGLITRSQQAATGSRRIAVYSSGSWYSTQQVCANANLTPVAGACAGSPEKPLSEITFSAAADRIYLVQVASTSPTTPTSGELEVVFAPAPTSTFVCCFPDGTCTLASARCYELGGSASALTACVPASANLLTQTFSLTANSSPVAIPDANATSTIPGVVEVTGSVQIPGGGRVKSVQVNFGALSHTYAGDVVIRLRHDGRSADVVNRAVRSSSNTFGSSANFVGSYSFADAAGQSVWPAAAALTTSASNIPSGTYRPGTINNIDQGLSLVFEGSAVNGDWTLRFEDLAAQDVGTFADATLTITYAPEAESPCTGIGACCQVGSNCVLSTAADCSTQPYYNLKFLGAGTTCTSAACPPTGDRCENAVGAWLPPNGTFLDFVDLSKATSQPGDAAPSCNVPIAPIGRSIWYSTYASAGSTLHVRVDELNPFDAIVAVYSGFITSKGSGGSCSMLTQIACANDPEPLSLTVPISSDGYHAIVVGSASPGVTAGKARITISAQPIVPSVVCCRGVVCTIESEPSCAGSGGGVVQPTFSCGPTSGCDVVCCRGTACTIETAASCAVGGTVTTGATTCTPDPCPIACCRSGVCSLETQAACAIGGGEAQTQTTCGPNTCTVRCCRGTTCVTVSASACAGVVAGSQSVIVPTCGPFNAMATCCFADFNHDGYPTIDDLFLYLNAYFTLQPWADFGGNGVNAPIIDDLFLFINAYFNGCW